MGREAGTDFKNQMRPVPTGPLFYRGTVASDGPYLCRAEGAGQGGGVSEEVGFCWVSSLFQGVRSESAASSSHSRVELKRLCEIFTRMFADPHSKVSLP